MTFQDYNFDPNVIKLLKNIKVYQPNEFQIKCLDLIKSNKNILAMSKTNSGKTLTYLMSLVNHAALNNIDGVTSIIVVPTKELCRHVFNFAKKISTYTKVKCIALYGGIDKDIQLEYLKRDKNIIIATPGRLLEILEEKHIDIKGIKHLVLDEYDELLSSNLKEVVVQITNLVKPKITMLFSASRNLDVKDVISNYEILNMEEEQTSNVSNYYYVVKNKETLLIEHLKNNGIFCALVFCNSKKQVENVYHLLKKNNIDCDYIHSNLEHNIRAKVTNNFRSGKLQVLVTTNLLSRGVSFKHLTHVINYDLAENNDIYLQRVGRSGRFEIEGKIYNYCFLKEENKIKEICNVLNITLQKEQV